MNASDPRWSRLSIVGKARLMGIGPFVSIGLFSMGAALRRMANGFAGAPNANLLVLLIGSVDAPLMPPPDPNLRRTAQENHS